MNVGGRSVTANIFFAGFTSPVDIDEDEKEFITAAAEQLGCKLSDSFFELGNLNKDIQTVMYQREEEHGLQQQEQQSRRTLM